MHACMHACMYTASALNKIKRSSSSFLLLLPPPPPPSPSPSCHVPASLHLLSFRLPPDHHNDEGLCPQLPAGANPLRQIEYGPDRGFPEGRGVGSASTLIAEKFAGSAEAGATSLSLKVLKADAQVATLLMASLVAKTNSLCLFSLCLSLSCLSSLDKCVFSSL